MRVTLSIDLPGDEKTATRVLKMVLKTLLRRWNARCVSAQALPLFEEEAKARMVSGKKDPSGKSSLGSKQDESKRATAQAAKATGAGVTVER